MITNLWLKMELLKHIIFLTVVTHRFIKIANIFLYIWITITVALSLMDLAFGILFALDYNDLMVMLFVRLFLFFTISVLIPNYSS